MADPTTDLAALADRLRVRSKWPETIDLEQAAAIIAHLANAPAPLGWLAWAVRGTRWFEWVSDLVTITTEP